MKVLWITSVYPSEQQPGSGVFHETQVLALKKLGIEVFVICPVPCNPYVFRLLKKKYQQTSFPEVYKRNGVTVYRPIYRAYPGQLRWAQPDKRIAKAILHTIKSEKLEFDLIHAHFAMPSGGASKILSEKLNKPWMLTLHGSDVHIYPTFSNSAEKVFQQAVHSAHKVIAVGENLADAAKEKTDRQCIVLPIGIDLSKFNMSASSKVSVRKRLNLPTDKKIISFVGRLVKEKGVFELAESLAYLPEDTVIVYIGDGPAKDVLQKHPAYNQRLFLLGELQNDDVIEYLFASDIFALPSYTEGMPTVVIEALALKIPVVCTRVGGVPDLFGKFEHLLIEPKSVQSLAERINKYLTDQYDIRSISEDLYQYVQKHYEATKNADTLKHHYKTLISQVEKV